MREAVSALGASCENVSIDAPLQGGSVTIRPGSVVWEGVPLLEAGAILVEAPVFPWPQPQRIEVAGERDARSLVLSALSIAALHVPVWNRPPSAHLAASRAVALDRLAAAEIRVHPFRLAPAPPTGSEGGGVVLDAVGRDRWHRPSRPAAGEPSLVLDPVAGEVAAVLVAGGAVAGALRHASALEWAGDAGGTSLAAAAVPEASARTALAAARELGLEIACVAVATATEAVLLVEAGPALEAWDAKLRGVLAPHVAGRLLAAARREWSPP